MAKMKRVEDWSTELFCGCDVDAFRRYEDLHGRELVIVACALLDAALVEMIGLRLVQDEQERDRLMVEQGAPIGDLGSRIRLAYLLGLLRKVEAETLHALRGLRNLFAHRVNISLVDDDAGKCVMKLIELSRYPAEAKKALRTALRDQQGTQFAESLIRHVLVDYQLCLNSRRDNVGALLAATSHYCAGGMSSAQAPK